MCAVGDGPLSGDVVVPQVDALVRAAKALPTFEPGRASRPAPFALYAVVLALF